MQFEVLISKTLAKQRRVIDKLKKINGINLNFFEEPRFEAKQPTIPSFIVLDEKDFNSLITKNELSKFENYHVLFIIFYHSADQISDIIVSHSPNCEFFDYALLTRLPEIIQSKTNYFEKLRKKVEQDRFKMMIQNMPVMVDALDENNNFVFWNKECEKVTGYSAQEIVNNPDALKILYPDKEYREKFMAHYAKIGNNFRNWELTLTTKSGEKKTISWSNLADIYQVPGWNSWAVGIDVTKQYQIQEKLQKTEFIFNTLMDIAGILNQWKTEEQIVEQIMLRIQQFIPFNSSIVLLYDYQNQIAEMIASIVNNQSYFKSAKPIPLKNLLNLDLVKKGQIAYINDLAIYKDKVSIVPSILKFGYKYGFISPLMFEDKIIGSMSFFFKEPFNLDETKETALLYIGQNLAKALKEKRLIQELNERIIALENDRLEYFNDLKKSEARLRAQFENLPIPTLIWRKQGDDFILVDYNDMAMASTFGSINELLGKSSKNISFFAPHLNELLQECFINEISLETQVKFTLPESDVSYYSLKMAYVAPDTVIMHFENITEQKTNELKFKQSNEIILKQLKIIELLKDERRIFKENLFPVINEICDRLWEKRKLVRNKPFITAFEEFHGKVLTYLDFFSKYFSIEADRLIKQPVKLSELIGKVSGKLKNELSEANAKILTYFDEPEVNTDEALLEQIFETLFQLSLVRKHPQRSHLIRVVSTKENGRIKLIVKDNGLGLSEMERKKFFNGNEFYLDLTNTNYTRILILKKLSKIVGSEFKIDTVQEEGCQYSLIFE